MRDLCNKAIYYIDYTALQTENQVNDYAVEMQSERTMMSPAWIKRSFMVDAGGTFAIALLTVMLNAIVNILIARFLGPEGKGVLTLVFLMLSQLSNVLLLGVDIALIHYAGRGRWNVTDLGSAAMGLGLCMGGGAYLLILLMSVVAFPTVIPDSLYPVVLLVSGPVLVGISSKYVGALLNVTGRVIEIGILGMATASIKLVLVAGALWWEWGLAGVIVAMGLSSVLQIGAMFGAGFKWGVLQARPSWTPALWKALVAYGIKLHLGNVLQSLNYRFDMYLVAFFVDATAVGLYSVAVGVAEWLWLLPDTLGKNVVMQRVATRTDRQANAMMGPLNRATSLVMLFGVLTVAVIGDRLIHLMYGQTFTSAFPALLILLPGTWAIGLWKNIIYDLAARGYPGAKLFGAGIAIVLTIMLDVIFIPRWGIVGAALASTVAYCSAFAAALWLYCRIAGTGPGDVLIPGVNDMRVICERIRDFLLPRPVTMRCPPNRVNSNGGCRALSEHPGDGQSVVAMKDLHGAGRYRPLQDE